MYEEHYKIFHENVTFAARALHTYLLLNKRVGENSDLLKVLEKNARFWNDYNYMALQSAIIALGRIFDGPKKAYSVSKLLNAVLTYKPYFNKDMLRVRKLELGGFEGLEDYLNEANELSAQDAEAIEQQIEKANALWGTIKPLRDSFYAHSEMLSDKKRTALFAKVRFSDLETATQILVNIDHSLEQAALNGKKPDFSFDYKGPFNIANGIVDDLIKQLMDPRG